MRTYSYNNMADRTSTISLKNGDVFKMDEDSPIIFEVGPNDTIRIQGKGDWKEIPNVPEAIKKFALMKKHFCVKTTGPIIDES